jgi:hypothetical protein
LRSKISLRGSLVLPDDHRIVRIESHIEKDGVLDFECRHDVATVEEQPPAIEFLNFDGKPGRITFDLLVTFTNGHRVLVTIKDEARAIRQDVAGFLRHIAPQIPRRIADGVMLYTERTISPAMKSNARLIHAVRRDPPHAADRAVLDLLPHIQGAVRVGNLVDATPYGADAFRAIVRLIARRIVLLTADARIGYDSWVTVANDRAEAGR